MRALTSSFPPVSWRVPKMVPSSVDLPTPLGPKTAMNSPGCTSKSSLDHKGSTAAWLKETNIKLQKDGWACIFGNAQAQPSYAQVEKFIALNFEGFEIGYDVFNGFKEVLVIRGSPTHLDNLNAFIFRCGANPSGHIGLGLRVVDQHIHVAGFKLIDNSCQVCGCWFTVTERCMAVAFWRCISHVGVCQHVVCNRFGLCIGNIRQCVQA